MTEVRQNDDSPAVLEPKLTKWDERVLATLAWWPIEDLETRTAPAWMSAWQVAEQLHEEDVALVRLTLDGLAHLGHAFARGFNYDHTREWVRMSR